MPQCSYTGPSGRHCEESAQDNSDICFWHDRNAPKTGENIKSLLEQKARARESMEGYELGQASLEDAYLIEADLSYANLTRVNLKDGHLFGINLKSARLFKTNLEHANLKEAVLEGADLLGANLNDTDLERVRWGDRYILRNHLEAENLEKHGDQRGARAKYLESEEIYRSICKRYEAAGTRDIAGDFFYWEMVVKRKQLPLFSFFRAWSKLVDLLCGYGEMPYRAIGSSALYIVFNALIFCILGMEYKGET
ncbi:MAG: pentapeptide repeat-containing protein, partial [bacterium]|nr:pentapeptide repeat-containing protein [bacterium]